MHGDDMLSSLKNLSLGTAFPLAAMSLLFTSPLYAQAISPPEQSEQSGPSTSGQNTTRSALAAVLEDGIPQNAIKRAQVRENLYALLATSDDKKLAEQIQRALQRLYMTSGSPTVDILMRRSVKAINEDKYAKALRLLNAVIKLAPDYAEGWNQRAFTFYKQNQLRQATGDLRRVLALDPNHFRALAGLGAILREVGDEVGAYRVFKRLNEVNPHSENAAKALEELKLKVDGRGI